MKCISTSLAVIAFIVLAPAVFGTEAADAALIQTINQRTGKTVLWQREQSARDQARKSVRALLHHELTAGAAAQTALLNNRSLQATLEEIGISRAEMIEAGLLKNPTLAGMLRFPDHSGLASNLEGELVQDFLDLLILPLRKRVARAQFEQTHLRVTHEVLKLAVETKVAFYELQAHQQLLGRLKLIRTTAEAAIDITQQQHKAGNIPDMELANQQAGYSQARLDAAIAEAEIREKREKLNRLMGVWGEDMAWRTAAELPPIPKNEISTAGLETLAIQQRLDLAAAKAELASVVQALGLSKMYRFAGALEFGVSSERDTDRKTVTGPTVKIELPIFNNGSARIAKGEAQLRQAENKLEALAVEIRSEVREHRDRLISKRDIALFYRDQLLPARLQVLNLMQLEYNAMLKGVFDLLTAKQREIEAERGYVEALRDYWIARTELERAVGGSLCPSSSSSTSKTHSTHSH